MLAILIVRYLKGRHYKPACRQSGRDGEKAGQGAPERDSGGRQDGITGQREAGDRTTIQQI